MIITDLDGTLLNSDQKVGDRDFENLLRLGEEGFIRVIATGRSPYSFSRVIKRDFPIDYLVFSSGAGVMDWKSGEILLAYSLPAEKVTKIANLFRKEKVSFKVLSKVPDNHHYVFYQDRDVHPDFVRRMEYYRGFETKICFDPPNFGEASQFLLILPDDIIEFKRLSEMCKGVKVVRATSPIDHQSIWMEVFHQDVSKAGGCSYICNKLGIDQEETFAVGNDYNDLDMLDYAARSFVVENAPAELLEKYPVVKSHDENGFSDALKRAGVFVS
ncbi:MAG: HAD-IIB family hydrolase [Bacteroidales bacterium]|nr:HAD-IIB family hydrolase [Bacteroidales bacterium]